jgi:DNA polymerase-3 subunit delta
MNKNVFFISGEDAFLIDEEIEKIISRTGQTSEEKAEVNYIDADELSPLELMEILDFSPLFFMQRIVILKNPNFLGGNRANTKRIEDVFLVLSDYFKRSNKGQILIVTTRERNSSNKIVKLLSKEAQAINCKKLSNKQLLSWIKNEFAARNCSINPGAASLLMKSGQDMYYLQNLIQKVSLIAQNGKVNEEEIEENLDNKEEIKVFKFTDALLKRNLTASFNAYNQLLAQGQHPIFILYMIVRQFISFSKVKYCIEKGIEKRRIAEITGLKDFTIRKMMYNTRNFSWDEIRRFFEDFLQADISFKTTSKNEKIIMEMLIIEICTKK